MGITSETRIDLEVGDPEKIIEDDEANRAYIIEVVGDNPVRVDHRERYAADGTTLSQGQSHTVSNLRGKRLYAAAFEGPTSIRVRLAAADVTSQPEREVSVVEGDVSISAAIDVEDRADREIGKLRVQNSDGVLVDPATDSVLSSELSREIATWSAGTLPVDVQNQYTGPSNPSGVASFTATVGTAGGALPALSVPDGYELLLRTPGDADPDTNSDPIILNGDFPLPPDSAIGLAVSDASNITASAASDGQTLYAIVESQ